MRIWIVVVLTAFAASAQAQVYKWKDAAGRTHYSSEPPASGQHQKLDIPQSFTGLPIVSAAPATRAGIQAPVGAREKVTLYTTPECGYCRQAKAYLGRRSIPYVERDVRTSDSALREFRSLGGRGVPVILVGQQRMDGYSEPSLAALLAQAGY